MGIRELRGRLIGFMAGGIAVADADDFSGTGEFKSDFVVSKGDDAAFFVQDFDCHDGYVFTIGVDCLTIGRELDGSRRAGGFLFRLRN